MWVLLAITPLGLAVAWALCAWWLVDVEGVAGEEL
jgi:hypothetical protein